MWELCSLEAVACQIFFSSYCHASTSQYTLSYIRPPRTRPPLLDILPHPSPSLSSPPILILVLQSPTIHQHSVEKKADSPSPKSPNRPPSRQHSSLPRKPPSSLSEGPLSSECVSSECRLCGCDPGEEAGSHRRRYYACDLSEWLYGDWLDCCGCRCEVVGGVVLRWSTSVVVLGELSWS